MDVIETPDLVVIGLWVLIMGKIEYVVIVLKYGPSIEKPETAKYALSTFKKISTI